MDVLIQLGVTAVMLALGFGVGRTLEGRHYKSIRMLEAKTRTFPVMNYDVIPPGWVVKDAAMVSGNVVISLDYFKRFVAGLRGIVGGRIGAYETLLDRARREAVLRMKKQAMDAGFDAVINVRLETARLASRGAKNGTAGVEMLAFGTAIRRQRGGTMLPAAEASPPSV